MQMPFQHLTWGWVEHIYLEIVSTDVYMFRRNYHLFYFQYGFFFISSTIGKRWIEWTQSDELQCPLSFVDIASPHLEIQFICSSLLIIITLYHLYIITSIKVVIDVCYPRDIYMYEVRLRNLWLFSLLDIHLLVFTTSLVDMRLWFHYLIFIVVVFTSWHIFSWHIFSCFH